MKRLVEAICLVAGIGVANLAYGVDGTSERIRSSVEDTRHPQRDPVASAQKRLDKLGEKLHLNASQQAAWQAYSAVMLDLAKHQAQERESWLTTARSPMEDLATPDKLERMSEWMRKGSERLGKIAKDTKLFYAQLGQEQKTIFDLYAKDAWQQHMRGIISGRMQLR